MGTDLKSCSLEHAGIRDYQHRLVVHSELTGLAFRLCGGLRFDPHRRRVLTDGEDLRHDGDCAGAEHDKSHVFLESMSDFANSGSLFFGAGFDFEGNG